MRRIDGADRGLILDPVHPKHDAIPPDLDDLDLDGPDEGPLSDFAGEGEHGRPVPRGMRCRSRPDRPSESGLRPPSLAQAVLGSFFTAPKRTLHPPRSAPLVMALLPGAASSSATHCWTRCDISFRTEDFTSLVTASISFESSNVCGSLSSKDAPAASSLFKRRT